MPEKSYNSLYQTARAAAIRDLIAKHRDTFLDLLHGHKHRLDLTHRHPDNGHSHDTYEEAN